MRAGVGGAAVGYAGAPTAEVAALRTLLAEKHAADAFELVVDHGSLAAQLMALSGLYLADHARFEARIAPYRSMNETVKVRRDGCSNPSDIVAVRDLVSRPDAVRLDGSTDTLQDWSQRNPGKRLVFDITGGAYPRFLAGTATRGG